MKNDIVKYLFLDDVRFEWWNHPESRKLNPEYYVVRSYDEFVSFFFENKMPEIISFDHDLGLEKDGMDCIKWLCEYIMDNNIEPLPEIHYHSMNPVGKENMKSYWSSFLKVMANKGE